MITRAPFAWRFLGCRHPWASVGTMVSFTRSTKKGEGHEAHEEPRSGARAAVVRLRNVDADVDGGPQPPDPDGRHRRRIGPDQGRERQLGPDGVDVACSAPQGPAGVSGA